MIEGLEEKAVQLGKKYFPDLDKLWTHIFDRYC